MPCGGCCCRDARQGLLGTLAGIWLRGQDCVRPWGPARARVILAMRARLEKLRVSFVSLCGAPGSVPGKANRRLPSAISLSANIPHSLTLKRGGQQSGFALVGTNHSLELTFRFSCGCIAACVSIVGQMHWDIFTPLSLLGAAYTCGSSSVYLCQLPPMCHSSSRNRFPFPVGTCVHHLGHAVLRFCWRMCLGAQRLCSATMLA